MRTELKLVESKVRKGEFPVGSERKIVVEKAPKALRKLDKSLMPQFFSGLCERGLGDGPHSGFCAGKHLEKVVQLVLARAFDHVDEKKDQDVEGKFAVACEGCGRGFVTAGKIFGMKNIFKKIYKFGTVMAKQAPCQNP